MFLYDREWGTDDLLEIESTCFRNKLSLRDGGLGQAEHFWKVLEILWPVGNLKHLIRNPWSDKMIEEACRWQYLSVSGPASATKTEMFAAWGIVNYIINPLETIVLVTSTSLKDARKRIWGAITDLWMNASRPMPGKLVDSIGMIRAEYDGIKGSDRCGIALITGERKKEKESIGKLIGLKNKNVILIGDELPELSPALLEAGLSNLSSNPNFQFIGIGNPNSRFDPHGTFSEPADGWKTINPDTLEWRTRLGYAIRFDGEKSPNVLAGKTIYPFLPTKEKLDKARRELGENSQSFWRMWRGYWCDATSAVGIYSEVDITANSADLAHVEWYEPPIPVAGCDLSYTNDGDETRLQFGLFGRNKENRWILQATENLRLVHNIKLAIGRNEQIIGKILSECEARGVKCENFGIDVTGGGTVFAEMLSMRWKNDFHRVNFSGAPSDLTILLNEDQKASEVFFNKVSELWGVGLSYLRNKQLRGIRGDLASQMTTRNQSLVKCSTGARIKVEGKAEMRKRAKLSPDQGDSFFIILDLCRHKHNFKVEQHAVYNAEIRSAFRGLASTSGTTMQTSQIGLNPQAAPRVHILKSIRPVKVIGGSWGNGLALG